MKFVRRSGTSSPMATRTSLLIFIAAVTVIATFNLAPQVLYSGLPQSEHLPTAQELDLQHGDVLQTIALQKEHQTTSENPTFIDVARLNDDREVGLDAEEERSHGVDFSTEDGFPSNDLVDDDVDANGHQREDEKEVDAVLADNDTVEEEKKEIKEAAKEEKEQQQQQRDDDVTVEEAKESEASEALAQSKERPLKPNKGSTTTTTAAATAASEDRTGGASKEPTAKAVAGKAAPSKATSNDGGTYENKYHVVASVSEGVYTEWQVRVCYFWYQKMKKEYPESAMGGFTRLLHSGKPDAWMDEIPTVVVDPLPDDLQEIANGYVVLNRPYAFQQWVRDHLSKIPEQYILMAEPDHLFVKPPPLLASPTKAAAFPFFYIEPQAKENGDIIQKYNDKDVPLEKFAPIGNSPVMISRDRIAPIINRWVNLSLSIKQDEVADKKWGWVQEMYAWSIASALDEAGPVEYSLHPELMLQPPWDETLQSSENGKDAYIIHYTYGFDFNDQGEFTPGKIGSWHWDKRDFIERYPPKDFPMPPEGCTNEAVKYVVRAVNEVAAALPGWQERAFKDAASVKPLYAEQNPEEEQGEGEAGEEKRRRRRNLLLGADVSEKRRHRADANEARIR